MWSHTVAILIGGQSKRMGSPKHLVTLRNGKTMLDVMLQIASSIGNKTIILGGEVEGQKCIQDLRKQHGPVGGIEALLHSDIDSNYLVLGCDMPCIVKRDILPLLESNSNAVFSHNNVLLGLPLHIHAKEQDACSEYLDSGGKSIRGFVLSIEHTSIPVDTKQACTFLSVNSRDDINKLALEKWS